MVVVVCGGDAAAVQDQSQQGMVYEGPQAGPALSLALMGPDLVVSGWGDGMIRAHARGTAAPGGQLRQAWFVNGAHSLAHSCGVTALAVAHRGHFLVSGGAGGEVRPCVWACACASCDACGSLLHLVLCLLSCTTGACSRPHARRNVISEMFCQQGVFVPRAAPVAPPHMLCVHLCVRACVQLRCWDARSREMSANMKMHMQAVNDVAVMADDAHFLAACEDRSLTAWDLGTQKCMASWRTPTAVRSVALAGDQVTFASAGAEKNVCVWDLRAPDPVVTLHNVHDGGEVCSVALTQPQGTPVGAVSSLLLGTGGADGVVKLFDLRAPGQQMPSPQPPMRAVGVAHTAPVTSMAFAPHSGLLVSGAADASIATWAL